MTESRQRDLDGLNPFQLILEMISFGRSWKQREWYMFEESCLATLYLKCVESEFSSLRWLIGGGSNILLHLGS